MTDTEISPETSAPTAFADMPQLHEHVVVALQRAGLTHAFPVQTAVIPVASEGRDVLVKSPTGSGKTIAFGLPIISRIARGARTPTAVILVPGRELAIQVRDELVPLAWALQLRCVAVYGGGSGARQAKAASGAPIIVATPGRLVDLVRQREIDLSQARMLVLDEADRMLDMGFAPQVEAIVQAMPVRDQTMLFSATLEGKVSRIAAELTENPERIERSELPGEAQQIEHVLVSTGPSNKVDTLYALLTETQRKHAVVFVRTQKGAANLCDQLRRAGLCATTIHGGMTQHERLAAFGHFRAGTADVLVATDVFARGMDLDSISHVINFELPEDADAYQHRTGRTGRAGRSGTAITLVSGAQRNIVEGLLLDLGLPLDLLSAMRKGSTERIQEVPDEQQYRDPDMSNTRRAKRELRRRPQAPRADAGEFGGFGNGRGAPLRRTAPARGAVGAGGSGSGTITTYDALKGFGFIKQTAGGKDVFFHRRAVEGSDDRKLRGGMSVSFGLEPGDGKKLRAKRVVVEAEHSTR